MLYNQYSFLTTVDSFEVLPWICSGQNRKQTHARLVEHRLIDATIIRIYIYVYIYECSHHVMLSFHASYILYIYEYVYAFFYIINVCGFSTLSFAPRNVGVRRPSPLVRAKWRQYLAQRVFPPIPTLNDTGIGGAPPATRGLCRRPGTGTSSLSVSRMWVRLFCLEGTWKVELLVVFHPWFLVRSIVQSIFRLLRKFDLRAHLRVTYIRK